MTLKTEAEKDRIDHLIDYMKGLIDKVLTSPPIANSVFALHSAMTSFGIPESIHPTADQLALCLTATVMTLTNYYFFMGKRHVIRRRLLDKDLQKAAEKVAELEEQILLLANEENASGFIPGKEIRIFMDGAFDMMHYGHMNAFRQGRSLGTHLVVGINSDESITKCKGAPVMNNQERLTAVEGCKFVDEVVPGCPYVMNPEYLDYVIKKYRIDYVVHGDDPCIVDGKDVYEAAKAAGKYQSIPRTEGVSTTDIVGRMLLMTKDHHQNNFSDPGKLASGTGTKDMIGNTSKFLTTSRMLRLFSAGVKAPEKGMRIVYVDGSWDMFHAGHISFLKKAKEQGDYLIVGVHNDNIVNEHEGSNMPIMNLHERVLSVLGCRFTDDVLIDAPFQITKEMIASLNISKVVRGSGALSNEGDEELRYGTCKRGGIYEQLESTCDFGINDIFERIQASQVFFQRKIEKKKLTEANYYEEKYSKNEHYKKENTDDKAKK